MKAKTKQKQKQNKNEKNKKQTNKKRTLRTNVEIYAYIILNCTLSYNNTPKSAKNMIYMLILGCNCMVIFYVLFKPLFDADYSRNTALCELNYIYTLV